MFNLSVMQGLLMPRRMEVTMVKQFKSVSLVSAYPETPVSLGLSRRMALCRPAVRLLINNLRIPSCNGCFQRLRKSCVSGWKLVIAVFISFVLATGCNQSIDTKAVSAAADNMTKSVSLDDRGYLLALPVNYDPAKAYKLLMAFHGSGGSGQNMQNFAGFERLSEDYIVVYPQAKIEEWNDGCQCNKTHRLGIDGWSDFDSETSYLNFTDKLHQALVALDEREVILVAFSSGNITATAFEQKYREDDKIQLKGMVWIDPDIFLPHSIAFYQDFPVTYYRKNRDQLMPHIASGAWTERTARKLAGEQVDVKAMTAGQDMDWTFFNAISQQRFLIDRQQTRAMEIVHYYEDLNAMAKLDLITRVPVSVIDSDFELPQIADNADAKETMTKWMEEGTQWSKLVAKSSGGQYIAVPDASHLVPLEHPDVIVDAINGLVEGN
jgi:pimeloyl-ACP methyl ester carboxylesterase